MKTKDDSLPGPAHYAGTGHSLRTMEASLSLTSDSEEHPNKGHKPKTVCYGYYTCGKEVQSRGRNINGNTCVYASANASCARDRSWGGPSTPTTTKSLPIKL